MISRYLRPAISLLVLMTILLGIVYPLIVTGLAQAAFPRQAEGSLLYRDGKLIGSVLIGQSFADPGHFWGRPSATSPQPYNGSASGGSNWGPLNPALIDAVKANKKALQEADPTNRRAIPVDLVTASASGLDAEISLAAAHYQAARVARARNMPLDAVEAMINTHQEGGLSMGDRRINVLTLNLALDALR